MHSLTPEQIAANPDSVIAAPRDTLDKVTIYNMPEGATVPAKLVIVGAHSRLLILGNDNVLYANLDGTGHHGRHWLGYRNDPDSRFFSDTTLRALRAAKLITGKAIDEHRTRQRERNERRAHAFRLTRFTEAAAALGIKPTRQQLRAIAKQKPVTA